MAKIGCCQTCSAAPMKRAGSEARRIHKPQGRVRKTTHPWRVAKSWGQNPGAKSGRQNPGNGFWTRRSTHPRGQNLGSKFLATDLGLGKTMHPRGQNPGNGFWNSENHSPDEVQNLGNGFGTWKTDLELGNPNLGAKSGGQNLGGKNPRNGFGTWKSKHLPKEFREPANESVVWGNTRKHWVYSCTSGHGDRL